MLDNILRTNHTTETKLFLINYKSYKNMRLLLTLILRSGGKGGDK